MTELQQLYQLRETQHDAINATELAIAELQQQLRTLDIDSIRAKLCGKTFISGNYGNTFYKIIEISDVHTDGVYCTVIELLAPSVTNNNSHVANGQAYYSHDYNDIEMDIAEFDATFDKIVANLISANLTN